MKIKKRNENKNTYRQADFIIDRYVVVFYQVIYNAINIKSFNHITMQWNNYSHHQVWNFYTLWPVKFPMQTYYTISVNLISAPFLKYL